MSKVLKGVRNGAVTVVAYNYLEWSGQRFDDDTITIS
jgi:hypothetical protein